MNRPDIHVAMRNADVTKFQLAERLGISERTVKELCNRQLTNEEYMYMMNAIKAIITERNTVSGAKLF